MTHVRQTTETNHEMQVRAVLYHPAELNEEIYQAGLLLVDSETQARIKRFYRREDACRTLLGSLLARLMLREKGVPTKAIIIEKTAHGKPYIAIPDLHPLVGFNITHDNALIAMAFAPGLHNGPAFNIGIDVMKVRVPGRESFKSFVETVGEQLTPLEHNLLSSDLPMSERLGRFFWMWTLKEAYTKALGLGLGFEFQRVEFDVVTKQVKIDGRKPEGWRFTMFIVSDGDDFYEGVVAEFIGGVLTEVIDKSNETNPTFLSISEASSVVRIAMDQLNA